MLVAEALPRSCAISNQPVRRLHVPRKWMQRGETTLPVSPTQYSNQGVARPLAVRIFQALFHDFTTSYRAILSDVRQGIWRPALTSTVPFPCGDVLKAEMLMKNNGMCSPFSPSAVV
jgi:hypothetical protein